MTGGNWWTGCWVKNEIKNLVPDVDIERGYRFGLGEMRI